jgi:hypothetical protein
MDSFLSDYTASFIQHNFVIHPCGGVHEQSIPFSEFITICLYSRLWTFGLFLAFGYHK